MESYQQTLVRNFGQGAVDVLAERKRQIEVEGFTAAHDDTNYRDENELVKAAVCFAEPALYSLIWPWNASWWKIRDGRRRCLVKAAALLIAAIDWLDQHPIEEIEVEG